MTAVTGEANVPAATVTVPESELPLAAESAAQAAPGAGRVQLALCLAVFFAALSFFAPTPFYPQMARDLDTTIPLLGQVMTLMALISAGLGLMIGPLADRYGYRWLLVIGVLAVAGTLLGTGLAPVYPVLLGLGLIGGLGDALAFSLPFALAATSFAGDAQRRAIGWTVAAISMAPVVGVPLVTAIAGFTSWRMALAAAGLTACAVAWFVAATLPPDARRPATPLRAREMLAAYGPLLRHPPSLRLYAVSALRGMWWLGLMTYLGAYLGSVVGLSAREIGLIYALAGGIYALGSVTTGGRLGAYPQRTVVAASCLLSVLIAPLLMTTTLWVILPLLLVASLGAAGSGVGVTALLAAESPAGAGTTMVLNSTLVNLGAAGGMACGGLLLALGGYSALGIGLSLAALLAASLAWWR